MASSRCIATMIIVVALCMSMVGSGHGQTRGLAANFNSWTKNVRYTGDGRGVQLVLDPLSAAGVGSKTSYLFGGFGAWIKLPPNDSAGTVTTFYMSSPGPQHYEFDFEFLGNRSGEPFLLHTNIFVDGVGGREQQIYLGFDPSAAFHYYNFQWNKDLLVFYVDNTPIRMFKNLRGIVPNFAYPDSKAMGVFLSIWDGSSWATQGGQVPINWASAPFVATYQNFRLNGCVVNPYDRNGVRSCQGSNFAAPGAAAQTLGIGRIRQMRVVRANQVKYNYCDDRKRYPKAPPECAHNTLEESIYSLPEWLLTKVLAGPTLKLFQQPELKSCSQRGCQQVPLTPLNCIIQWNMPLLEFLSIGGLGIEYAIVGVLCAIFINPPVAQCGPQHL